MGKKHCLNCRKTYINLKYLKRFHLADNHYPFIQKLFIRYGTPILKIHKFTEVLKNEDYINIDSLSIQLSPDISFRDLEYFIQFQQPIHIKYISTYEDTFIKNSILSIGDRAKFKIQLHKASKTIKLEFYGLFQYQEDGTPINELYKVLQIIEALLNILKKPLHLTRVDLTFDTQEKILTALKPKLIMFANMSYRFKPKSIKIFKDKSKTTGISFNKPIHRFKLTAYDKAHKNKLKLPLYRLELSVKEKYNKPVQITEMLNINSYLKLIKFEYAENLSNNFEPYIY